MKKMRMIPLLFGILALAVCAVSLHLTQRFLNASPVLVEVPDAATEQVNRVMGAICEGDYETASRNMYGCPDLGLGSPAADRVGVLVWEAFADSMSYELSGACFATDAGLAQKVIFRCLDFSSVLESLGSRTETLLTQRVEEAEDISEIYDENNEYREEFVMDALYEAAKSAVAEDARFVEQEITLNMVHQDGQWWILPEQDLIRAISGGIVG